jgi:hypothetical protein
LLGHEGRGTCAVLNELLARGSEHRALGYLLLPLERRQGNL